MKTIAFELRLGTTRSVIARDTFEYGAEVSEETIKQDYEKWASSQVVEIRGGYYPAVESRLQ